MANKKGSDTALNRLNHALDRADVQSKLVSDTLDRVAGLSSGEQAEADRLVKMYQDAEALKIKDQLSDPKLTPPSGPSKQQGAKTKRKASSTPAGTPPPPKKGKTDEELIAELEKISPPKDGVKPKPKSPQRRTPLTEIGRASCRERV